MWGGQGSDPGGTESDNPTSPSPSNQELKDLKDQYDQQQVLISQLKEIIRKSEQTTVTEEKLEGYANTLTRMSARAKMSSKNKATDADMVETMDTPAKEKIMFLRQQMEENKLKLAERKKFHKGIEDTVTQLKAQLDDSQHNVYTPLNLSLNETKTDNYNMISSTEELISLLVAKDKRMMDQSLKIQKLEANVLDLQENVKEKDSVIDARTKAITLMTESLSKKGKNTLDALDDTKEQMRKMQENFVTLEMEMKGERQEAIDELDKKCLEVNSLKDEILVLQNKCQDQQVEIVDLKKENEGIVGLNDRIKELEKVIEEFESKSTDTSIKSSPQRSSKRGKRGQKIQKSKSKESSDEVDANVEMKKLTDKISKYEATINELNFTIEEFKNKPEVSSKTEGIEEAKLDEEEIAKLKKQLDESNKNMIKMKAQNKSKLKELNKVISQLKGGDTSKAEEGQNPKIEEGFDNLAKEQLELTISKLSEEVSMKNQSIADLEQQLDATKELSNLKSAQVESEITSIHFEERVDELEVEKKQILLENEVLLQEKCELLEKLESLSKEKQELLNKLDNYMQENMDLIDKLEKLSAEKVSSAESIEIVESFTQQEKLELEAYQKSFDMDQSVKNSSENLAENQELNESVNQLTEETSDLLRKIELFTEERREVMDKMEALTLENNQLTSKIHEIENNRDILSETYEQLQNEKEDLENKLSQLTKRITELEENIKGGHKVEAVHLKSTEDQHDVEEYKNLIEIQKLEIQELKLQLLSQKDLPATNDELRGEISSLQNQYEALLEENQKLSSIVKENGEKVHEKDSLETELKEARNRIQELDEKLLNNIEEVENYRSILDENKEELIGSATKIDRLQCQLLESEKEVLDLNCIVQQLQQAVSHLENDQLKEKDDNLELMTDQLQELKTLLTENIQQIQIYENELAQNSETISVLNEQLGELNQKLLDMENDLESKDFEINELIKIRDQREKQIENLQSELKHKEDNFHKICNDLKEKCLSLQHKIEQNADSLDHIKTPSLKLEELENKNKEQLEKMKKIAANLKRKTVAYQELDAKLKENQEKHELEVSEKAQLQETLKIKDEKIASLLEQLDELEKTYLNVQNSLTQQTVQFGECNQQLTYFATENEQLRNSIENQELQLSKFTSMKEMDHSNECNALNFEINEKNLVINNLQEQLESSENNLEITSNALNVKIRELEMFIENQEAELGKYKERIAKLEEGLSNIEDRRQFLEQQNFRLDEQLREKSNSFEEISHTEDMLEQRIASLMEQDDEIQKTLKEMNLENHKLFEHNRELIEENSELKIKLDETSERHVDVASVQEKLMALKMENEELSTRLNDGAERYHHLKGFLDRKQEEIELMEGELQGELERLDSERKSLSVQCEQLREQLTVYGDNRQILEEEIEMYKSKVEQQQNDFERKLEECEKLNRENKINQNHIEDLTNKIANLQELVANSDKETSSTKLQIISDHLVQSGDDNEGIKLIQEEPEHTTETTLSNFVWPDSSASNFFDSVSKQPQENIASVETVIEPQHEVPLGVQKPSKGFTEDDKEELLKKIKTLEFMLYNIEQEKDDVLLQCQSLTNEISRLIYERQNPLESQICSETDSVLTSKDCEQLQQIQFVPTRNPTEQEDIITHTSTYLCYNPDALKQVEPQICSGLDTNLTESDLKQIQDIEFDTVTDGEGIEKLCISKPTYFCYELEENLPTPNEPKVANLESQILPAQVEFVKPKSVSRKGDVKFQPAVENKLAYFCPESEETPSNVTGQAGGANLDIFDENDDGWGCGMDEVILEENHRQRMDNISRTKNLALHVEALEEKVQVLEVERQRHIEEIKQAQIKSGKLIKKLKEFKSLNDKLNSDLRKSDEFGGLNDAIVDELKLQVVQLEKKIKENVAELEKEKSDKSNLVKKVDTLQVSGDRLKELKDKQEVEILSCQRQNKELMEKLQQFEWGNEGFDSPVHAKIETQQNVGSSADENEKKIADLTNTIKELSLDNEDLQLMLEEQRNLRISAEKSKSVEPILENMKTEAEYMCIVQEKHALNSEKEYLNGQLELLTKDNEMLQKKAESLNSDNVLLEQQLFDMKGALQNMEDRTEWKLNSEKEYLNGQLELLTKDNEMLQKKAESLNSDNVLLEQQLFDMKGALQNMEDRTEWKLNSEKEYLNGQLELLTKDNEMLQKKAESLNSDNVLLEQQLFDMKGALQNMEDRTEWKLNSEKEYLNGQLELLTKDNEMLQKKAESLNSDNVLLEQQLFDMKGALQNMEDRTEWKLNSEKEYLNGQLELLTKDNEMLQKKAESLNSDNVLLEQQLFDMKGALQNMEDRTEWKLNSEKEYLNGQLELLTKDNEMLQKKAESLNSDNVLLEQQLFDMKGALQNMEDNLTGTLEGSRNEFLQLTENYNVCNQKLVSLEDQHRHEIEQLENDLEQLKKEKIDLENVLHERNVEIETQTNSSNALDMKVNDLEEQLKQIGILAITNGELNEKLKSKDRKIEDVKRQLEEVIIERSTLTASIENLEDEWNQRVDQRGADVAESWKLHLEMREKEFLITEQQFRKEINDLEEKCNAIVNENNELRKNVDAEIRNEVDRISALQQQIYDRDHHINELKLMLQEMRVNLELQNEKVAEYETKCTTNDAMAVELVARVTSLEVEIAENVQLITMQKENLQNFENVQQHLQESQFTITNLQLEMEDKTRLIAEYLEKLESANKDNEENRKRLENKDSCIANLQQNLQDMEKNVDNVNNYNTSLLNQQINDLNVQLEDKRTQFESLNFKFNENLQVKDAEVNKLRNEIENLTLLLKDKENLILQNNELQLLNNQLAESNESKDDDMKQLKTQINQLELLLVEREKEYTQSLTVTNQENETMFEKIKEIDIIKRREAQLEISYDELLSAKNADMENLNMQFQCQTEQCDDLVQKLQQQEGEVTFLKNELNMKNQDYEELYNKSLEQSALLNEENKQLSELRLIIEEQVMKIEDLKQELFEKSKDYDSLIAELDIRKSSRVEQGNVIQQDVQQQHSSSMMDGSGEIVSQAELDLALYMLHQRDVRCEELTVELMQLLEERDTLQLKLSNAIREKEEIKDKILGSSVHEKSDYQISSEVGTSFSDPTPSNTSDVTSTELAAEAREGLQSVKQGEYLADKLSQLKSVGYGYGKDKVYLDEQQRRRLQQLSLMQQHRDVASLLPPEAAARLVHDANYTLSRDVQSPSKVLLNWLWGKSTPKVNDI